MARAAPAKLHAPFAVRPRFDRPRFDRPRFDRSEELPRPSAALYLELGLLMLSICGSLLGSILAVHPEWSLVAFVNYIWLCVLLFRLEPRGTVLVLPQLIVRGSEMIALIMIEYGAEMFELGTVGRPGPWSSAFNLYNLLYCMGLLIVARPLLRALDRTDGNGTSMLLDRFARPIATGVLLIVGLIALNLLLRGLQSGFPLLAGIDRFVFRRFAADKVTLYALNLKFVLAYALGFIAFVLPVAQWQRRAAGFAFIVMIVLFFLFGDKFFTQLVAVSAFGAPYLYRHHAQVMRKLGRYLAIGALSISAVAAVSLYIYSDGLAQTPAATAKRVSGRMVGQGELWYLQSSIGAPALDWNADLLTRYLASLRKKEIDLFSLQNSIGPHYFSNRYSPDKLRASLERNGGTVTYTMVAEPMGLVLFGWVGLGALELALGMLFALAGGYIAYAIRMRSIVSGVLASYIFLQLNTSVVQAAPWVIGSIYSLRWLTLILIIELLQALPGRGAFHSASARSPLRHRRPLRRGRTTHE